MTGQPIARRLAKRIRDEGGDEAVIDRVAAGDPVTVIAEEYKVSRSTLMRWIRKTDSRHSAYKQAKTDSADALVEEAGQILDNVKPTDGPRVQQAKSRAEHRRWVASKRDRAQYGDDAKALVAVNLDLGTLHLDALRQVGHMDQIPEAEVELLSDGTDAPAEQVVDVS